MSEFESSYIRLANHKGLEVTLSTLGAGVRSLRLNGKPMILELCDEQTYLRSPQLFGKTISRYICRTPSHGQINGVPYVLKEDTPGICLHGGTDTAMTYRQYDGMMFEDEQAYYAVFTAVSPDGENGFPGNLKVKITYLLAKDINILTIKIEALSDKDTIINISNHCYWHFPDSMQVDNYQLQIKASRYGTFAEDSQLVVGMDRVPECLDFTSFASLGLRLNQIETEIPRIGVLDHTFILDHVSDVEPQVILKDKHYQVECYTDYEAVNAYVDSTQSDVDFENDSELKKHIRRAIAIEPQLLGLNHFVLKANEPFYRFIAYRMKETEDE